MMDTEGHHLRLEAENKFFCENHNHCRHNFNTNTYIIIDTYRHHKLGLNYLYKERNRNKKKYRKPNEDRNYCMYFSPLEQMALSLQP